MPSGSVTQADLENRRKDAVIVQDFLKETMVRETLQKELGVLKQENINISNEKTQLKKLLAEKESLLVEKDKKLSETQSSNDTSRAEHSSFMDQMEKKFSFEAKDLREKKEKLEVELAEAKAKKQEVLDQLSAELEKKDEEYKVEKSKWVRNASDLQKAVDTLRQELELGRKSNLRITEERAKEIEGLKQQKTESDQVINDLRTKSARLEQDHADEIRSRDEKVYDSSRLHEELKAELDVLERRHGEAIKSYEAKEVESKQITDSLQAKLEILHQDHTDELRRRDEVIQSHSQSVDQLRAQMHALQERHKEATKAIELNKAQSEALKIKTKEADELSEQLDAMNDQLATDAAEGKELKAQIEGLKKTIETLEQISKQHEQQHSSSLSRMKAELDEAKQKTDKSRLELDTVHEKHRQDLLAVGEDYDREIESIRADLEGDAKKRLDELQTKHDALLEEKKVADAKHDALAAEKAQSANDHVREIESLRSQTDNAKKAFDDLQVKYGTLLAEKTATENTHTDTLKKLQADLERKETESNELFKELQDNFVTLVAEKDKAAEDHTRELSALKAKLESKQKVVDELQTKHGALAKKQAESEQRHADAVAHVTDSLKAEYSRALADLQEKHDSLAEKLADTDQAHEDAVALLTEELKEGHSNNMTALQTKLDEVQAKHDQLVKQKVSAERAHAEALERKEALEKDQSKALKDLQSKHDTLIAQQSKTAKKHAEELDNVRSDWERKYMEATETAKTHEGRAELLRADLASLSKTSQDEIEKMRSSLKEEHSKAYDDLFQKYTSSVNSLEASRADLSVKEAELVKQINEIGERLGKEKEKNASLHEEATRMLAVHNDEKETLESSHAVTVSELREQLKNNTVDHLRLEEEKQALEDERERWQGELELMKADVVRKHVAVVDKLEKERNQLAEKVKRLEGILAAGDRVARAAATVGTPRAIDTVTEEDEEEDEEDEEDNGEVGQATHGASESYGVRKPTEVLGTLAAMQESLRQLNDLNDEVLMESSRTAEKLAAHAGIEAEVD